MYRTFRLWASVFLIIGSFVSLPGYSTEVPSPSPTLSSQCRQNVRQCLIVAIHAKPANTQVHWRKNLERRQQLTNCLNTVYDRCGVPKDE